MTNSSMQFRPNDARANKAMALIWIILTLEIVSFISGFMQMELLQVVADGGSISEESATLNDTREQVVGIVYLIAFVISAYMFIQWFRRAYFNLHLLSNKLSFSEGWAAGAWFVPIISLYRPLQIMKELFETTIEILKTKGNDMTENYSSSLLSVWWTLWIISGILGQFIFRFSSKAETVEQLITLTEADLVSSIIGVPLALVTIRIIKKYSEIESQLPTINWTEEELLPAKTAEA